MKKRNRKTLYPEYYQFRMTKMHRDNLDKIASHYKTTPAEILRQLIVEKHEQLIAK